MPRLKGGWNVVIGWSRLNQTPPLSANAGQGGGAARDPAEPVGLSSYEAVERQPGVKLVKQRRSVAVVVADHVDEKPVE